MIINRFARVGMSHISRDITEPLLPKIAGKVAIDVNTSSQPNANPHFGTITTMMCVFAIAEHLRDRLNLPTTITFDQLENAPDRSNQPIRKRNVKGQDVDFQIALSDSLLPDGRSVLEANMDSFRKLFGFLSNETGVEWKLRTYRECQSNTAFRSALLGMFQRRDEFTPITSPHELQMRLRFPCPTCHWIDKESATVTVQEQGDDRIVFAADCPDHGKHIAELSESSNDFFDSNTPLRDIAKGYALAMDSKRDNFLSVMVDGRDWSGRWNNMVFSEGITRLGVPFHELPVRFFTPAITDPLGAKLSKSLYVGQTGYSALPPGFKNMQQFMDIHGEDGLRRLWQHVRGWAKDPAFIDRDSYSVGYFEAMLKGDLPPAELT